MFGSKQREIDRLTERLDEERKRDCRTNKMLMECFEKRQENAQRYAKGREEWATVIESAQAQRDEAQAEIKKLKRELFDAENKADQARREARRLEMRLNLMNAEPMHYVVQSEGRPISVTAVFHEEIPDGELILFDRDEAVVASFKNYSSYRIEPIPAE